MRRCEMAEVSVAALLVCALVLQTRAQGSPEPCGNGGQCQTRCYSSFSSTLQAPQVNSGTCPNNLNRQTCCTGATPSWQWSQWSGCSGGSSCSQGRYQTCKAANGEDALAQDCPVLMGSVFEQQPCPSTACFRLTEWSSWSPCSSRCSSGSRTRTRSCVDSQGSSLPASSCAMTDSQLWETSTCDGKCDAFMWSSWRVTSQCNTQCLEAVTRVCLFNGVTVDASSCSGLSQDTRPCASSQNCPGYRWSEWVGQGSCDFNTCTEPVTRTCLDSNSNPAATSLCGGTPTASRRCSCPSPSIYGWSSSKWGAWSGCVTGVTSQVRRRPCVVLTTDVVVPDFFCTGSSQSQTQSCGISSQYGWSTSQWGQWSGCSSGQVTETRRRPCEELFTGIVVSDFTCTGTPQTESRSCQYVPTQWSVWSGCGFGGSTETRTRQCQQLITLSIVSTSFCTGHSLLETRNCSSPYGWSTSQWGQWSGCSSGLSSETRRRQCEDLNTGSVVSDFFCTGTPQTESRSCQYGPTQWSVWSGCGFGGSTETRTRQCQQLSTFSIVSNSFCTGHSLLETRNCFNVQYTWGPWSDFGICSAPCGQTGLKTRQKFCEDSSGNAVADDLCNGDRPSQSEPCTTVCTTWNTWGGWSSTCSYPTCTQTRTRNCPATDSCQGPNEETRACYANQCASGNYGAWSEWSACDRSCRQFRSRTCLSTTACSGASQESRVCETCPKAEVCGKFYYTEPRIFNGNDTTTCRWPWMANVRTNEFGGYTSLCSAVLIDQNTLVTSASCVSRINSNLHNVQVVLNDRSGLSADVLERVFSVSSAYPHSSFNEASGNAVFSPGNIGIIQLSSAVGYGNDCIQPVCLPDSNTQFSQTHNYIAAWGRTTQSGPTSDSLKEAGVKVTSGLTCSVSVSFSGRYNDPLPEDLICSNYLRSDQAVTCPRDEGGMLVAQDTSGAWVLRGINVDNVCDVSMPNMFVDAKQYVGFLKAEMAKN